MIISTLNQTRRARRSGPGALTLSALIFCAGFASLRAEEQTVPAQFSQSGRKNRIVFDYSPTPTPPPAPSPTPKEGWTYDRTAEASPTPTPVATSTPSIPLLPEATPAIEAVPLTPEPAAQPSSTPLAEEATPSPTAEPSTPPEPTPMATPATSSSASTTPQPDEPQSTPVSAPASEMATSTPTPEPAAESQPAPSPAESAPTATPAVAQATPSPEPTPAAAEPVPTEPAPETAVAATTPSPEPTTTPVPAAAEPPPAVAAAPAPVKPEPVPPAESPVAAQPSTPAPAAKTETVVGASPEGALPMADDAVKTDVVSGSSNVDLAPVGSAPVASSGTPTPSESVTINLINKLVQRGILTKEDAKEMVVQAEAEATAARQQMQADMFAIAQVAAAEATADQALVSQQAAVGPVEEDISVTYIPEPVKTQIKEDIKMELAAEARKGSFALGPVPKVPSWVARIRPFADFRFRYEGDFFPNGNDATGAFPNFNAINTGAPFDVTGTEFAPQFNVDQNRNRFRIRLRLGAEMDITDSLTAGIRLATGENNSPVTTNQTVGLANQGQGGNFSRYAIWLDRAFVRYEIGKDPDRNIGFLIGRFDNPFFGTNLIWDDDLGFDGIALQARYQITDWATPFLTAGAFPVFNTDFNFSSNQPSKFQSYDKYLFGGQLGVELNIAKDWDIKLATSYYYFHNIEGQLSSPYTPQSASDAGDTDNSRPSFAQKGNTYFPIRNIVPDASNDFGAINQWQYYGLATKFQELAVTGRIDYNGFEPVQISLIGEFVQNLAFNQSDINAIAVNNRGPDDDDLSNTIGEFDGSPQAWLIDFRVGTPSLSKAWDWGVTFGYRWIGSDAVVDGFNDSDFGLGGTNMKGFTVGGALALSPNVWMGLKWMGSDSLAGPTFKVNVIQFDLHTKF